VREKEEAYFNLLKEKIVMIMKQSFPGIDPSISNWKGQEITDFQEDLSGKVHAHISEKWFYTHMKTGKHTLPRIDVLNLLSRYAGYANWDDFKFRTTPSHSISRPGISANRYFVIVPLLMVVILTAFFFLYKVFTTREYRFCFYDADTREHITSTDIEVTLLLPDESPQNFLCTPQGCLTLKTGRSSLTMVVRSAYYQTDTITRRLDKFNRNETVKLHPDNYALMIHYFSRMKVTDWQKRRTQLDRMIADSALIYQVFGREETGMELYNKWEFINTLTMPSGNLKNIEILDTKYKGNQLMLLRFRVNKQPQP